jgi:acetylornithine deacetylase/succinyl-diaminopimelate desuccinylase-like protein
MTTEPLSEKERQQLEQEGIRLCQELLRIDTTNPPGDESEAARVLDRYLSSHGVETEIFESEPGRASVVARVPGHDRAAAPGLLLSHLDTSPIQAAHWTFDPFAGDIVNGYIRGRGAVDLKSLVAAHAVGLAWLVKRGIVPSIDLVMLSVADETRGGAAGIRWIEQHRPELLNAGWVLGEGCFTYEQLLGSKQPVFTYCPHEKTALWVEVIATGPGGHSSIPRVGTAVERLTMALTRIRHASQFGAGPAAEAFIDGMTSVLGLAAREETLDALNQVPAFAAMLVDTVNPTIVHAGMEPSVVPSTAVATVDCRLRPETDPDDFLSLLRELIDDPDVEVRELFRAVSGSSPIDGTVPRHLRDAVRAISPDAVVLPIVSAGYTDLRAFRARGIDSYGCHVVPLLLEDRARISGHDERIPVDGLAVGTLVIHDFLARW